MHAHNRSNSRRQAKIENSKSNQFDWKAGERPAEKKEKRKLIKEKLKSGTPRKTIEKRNRH
jgi:hypothetical protein